MRIAILIIALLLAAYEALLQASAQTPPPGLNVTQQAQVTAQIKAAVATALKDPIMTGGGKMTDRTSTLGHHYQWNLTKTYDAPWDYARDNQQINRAFVLTPQPNLWNNMDDLDYAVPGGSDISAGNRATGNVITRYIQGQRHTNAPNIPQWATILSMVDWTNNPGRLAGPIFDVEVDMEASGPDDCTFVGGPCRVPLNFLMIPGRNYAGNDTLFTHIIDFWGDENRVAVRSPIHFAVVWTEAGIDLSQGKGRNGAPAIKLAPDQTIQIGSAPGATCSGLPTPQFATAGGIITHC